MDNKDFATLLDFVQQGGALSGLANVDQKDLDLLYRYAMQLMTYGDYHGAKRIFSYSCDSIKVILNMFMLWQLAANN